MAPLVVDPAVSSQVRSLVRNEIGKEGIIYVDVDGCLMPESEHARAEAYAVLLKRATGKEQDVAAVHDEWAGPAVDITISKIKEKYNLPESLEELLKEHDKLYFDRVREQTPNPYILEILDIAKEEGIPCIFLSNGRDNGIRSIFKHFGIEGFDDCIYAYDSEKRKIDGQRVPDKVEYFAYYANLKGISLDKALAIEDNAKTAEKLGNLKTDQGGVKVLYVFNGHNQSYVPPSTGISLDCERKPVRRMLPMRGTYPDLKC
jgi:phosphoglycolate phosphatase-like HAD superfamily hydrolase